ncbi:1542_t:CDS:2 [Cetraspora pellucida]|uniref:1542_t:CDS:1 n=1 Tax=Cetraspora pellucida TaxID=1433469 RepID=A0A9N9DAA7_9GLOM|nr:1542_t:CDS:2 [Cetraspora pellucida]
MATTVSGTESSFGVNGAGCCLSSKVTTIGSLSKKLVNLIQDITESKELPCIKAKGKKRDKIFEMIHDIFNVEIVDNKFFIKFNSLVKSEIHSKYRPEPARNQRIKPIINSSKILIGTYDNSGDRDNAINKFARIIISATETAFPTNSNPGVGSVTATPKMARPSSAPCLGHLSARNIITAIQWYKMKWNRHLVLRCGVNIDFNDKLEEIYN